MYKAIAVVKEKDTTENKDSSKTSITKNKETNKTIILKSYIYLLIN